MWKSTNICMVMHYDCITFRMLTPDPIFTSKYGNKSDPSKFLKIYWGLSSRWNSKISLGILLSMKLHPFIKHCISSSLSTLCKNYNNRIIRVREYFITQTNDLQRFHIHSDTFLSEIYGIPTGDLNNFHNYLRKSAVSVKPWQQWTLPPRPHQIHLGVLSSPTTPLCLWTIWCFFAS
jgi:hypothetical protein